MWQREQRNVLASKLRRLQKTKQHLFTAKRNRNSASELNASDEDCGESASAATNVRLLSSRSFEPSS